MRGMGAPSAASPSPSSALTAPACTSGSVGGTRRRRGAVGRRRASAGKRECTILDASDGLMEYGAAWEWQTAQVRARLDAETGAAARSCDAALLVQHPPVYTLGRGSLTAHLHFHPSNPPPGSDCVRTDRGGEATFHGPGQLVLYPILDLNYHGRDIHEYMRLLEELVIVSLKDCCGIEAGRMEGLTGVWVDDEKVAAVGVGMRRWISYHGVALNVCTDLEAFNRIVPCGISDRGVCSVQSILGEDACPDIGAVASSMKNAFAAVFGLSLVEKSAEGVPR